MRRLLQWCRVPGLIRPFSYRDAETGEAILTLRTSPRYTVLTVSRREFYFDRVTGKLDGTGAMALGDDLAINGSRADRIQRSRLAREHGD